MKTGVNPIAPVRAAPLPLLSWWLLGRWATRQLEAELQSALLTVTPEVLQFRAATALRFKSSPGSRSVSVPVLQLRATNDRLLSRRSSKQIASAIPHCTTVDIAGPQSSVSAHLSSPSLLFLLFSLAMASSRRTLPKRSRPPCAPQSHLDRTLRRCEIELSQTVPVTLGLAGARLTV